LIEHGTSPDSSDRERSAKRHLVYGEMAQDTFPAGGGHWYAFDAREGDVVSILLAPHPRPAIDPDGYEEALRRHADPQPMDPEVVLYPPAGAIPLAAGTNITSISGRTPPLDDHLRTVIPAAGLYRVLVREARGRDFEYRLRINLIGGPHLWQARQPGGDALAYLRDPIDRALQPLDAPVPGALALTERNAVGPVLHGAAIFFALAELVANARYEVGVRSGNINASDPLGQIAEGARRLQRRLEEELRRHERGEGPRPHHPVVIRIIPDLLLPIVFWPLKFVGILTLLKRKCAEGILGMFNALDPRYVRVEVAVHQHVGPGEDHSKIVHVDGRCVHIGGANLHSNNSFDREERDTAYLYAGEVAQRALRAFDHSWHRETNFHAVLRAGPNGEVQPEGRSFNRGKIHTVGGAYEHPPAVLDPDWDALGIGESCIPMFYLDKPKRPSFFANSIDHPIAQGLLAAMDGARSAIHMTAPNVNDEPVIDAAIYALMRGVSVRLLLPYKRNLRKVTLPFGGGSNEDALKHLQRRLTALRSLLEAGQVDLVRKSLSVEVDVSRTKPLHEWGQFEFRWWVYNSRMIADGPGAYHIKLMTIDRTLVYNGSTNWDGQSLNRARETSVIVLDPTYAHDVDRYVFGREWNRRKGNPARTRMTPARRV